MNIKNLIIGIAIFILTISVGVYGISAIYGKSPFPEDIVASAAQSTQQYFLKLIEVGKQRGEVRPEVDSGVTAFIFTAALVELNGYLMTQVQIDAAVPMTEQNYSIYEVEVARIYRQMIAILKSGIAM